MNKKLLISDLNIHRKWRNGKMILHENGNKKKAEVVIHISDKTDLKKKRPQLKTKRCIT